MDNSLCICNPFEFCTWEAFTGMFLKRFLFYHIFSLKLLMTAFEFIYTGTSLAGGPILWILISHLHNIYFLYTDLVKCETFHHIFLRNYRKQLLIFGIYPQLVVPYHLTDFPPVQHLLPVYWMSVFLNIYGLLWDSTSPFLQELHYTDDSHLMFCE